MSYPSQARREMRNDRSRSCADNHRQPWTSDELDELMAWNHSEAHLVQLAESLGRTLEACRQRFYETEWGRPCSDREHEEPRLAPRPSRVRWVDDDDWPDWYVRG